MFNSIFVVNGKGILAVDTEKETLVSELVRHMTPAWAEKKAAAEDVGEEFSVKDELVQTLDVLNVKHKVLGDDVHIVSFDV